MAQNGHTTENTVNRGNCDTQWRIGALPPAVSVYAVAAVTGLIAGTGAFLLKILIKWVSLFLTSHFDISTANWALTVIPLAGILLTVFFQRRIIRRNLEHGVEQVITFLHKRNYNIPHIFLGGPLVASTLTLGFGGSAGAEGPIATTGATIGSILGRWTGMPPRLMMIMIGCGAGAGIAGIFKAPLGGVMFTLEVLGMPLGTVTVIALIIACVVAGLTSYGLTGFVLDVPLTHPQYFDPQMTAWVLLLGFMCGFYALYYNWINRKMRACYMMIRSPWLRGIVSGGILSLTIFLFPALYGEGYDVMAKIIDGNPQALVDYGVFNQGSLTTLPTIILVCAGMALLKSVAAVSSNSGGGVAGDFAPTLFAGCIFGYMFASVINVATPGAVPAENFALIGMAAVMAGTIHAPLMAMFIVVEMTGYYGMLFPSALAATVAYGVVWCAERFIRK